MNFTCTFDTANAAFDGGNGPDEAARILRKIAGSIADIGCDCHGPIHDSNGNRIGSWDVEYPEPEDEDEDAAP